MKEWVSTEWESVQKKDMIIMQMLKILLVRQNYSETGSFLVFITNNDNAVLTQTTTLSFKVKITMFCRLCYFIFFCFLPELLLQFLDVQTQMMSNWISKDPLRLLS